MDSTRAAADCSAPGARAQYAVGAGGHSVGARQANITPPPPPGGDGRSTPLTLARRARACAACQLSNHVVLHARDGFVDHDDPALRRHLLRLWLSLDAPYGAMGRVYAAMDGARLVWNLARGRLGML